MSRFTIFLAVVVAVVLSSCGALLSPNHARLDVYGTAPMTIETPSGVHVPFGRGAGVNYVMMRPEYGDTLLFRSPGAVRRVQLGRVLNGWTLFNYFNYFTMLTVDDFLGSYYYYKDVYLDLPDAAGGGLDSADIDLRSFGSWYYEDRVHPVFRGSLGTLISNGDDKFVGGIGAGLNYDRAEILYNVDYSAVNIRTLMSSENARTEFHSVTVQLHPWKWLYALGGYGWIYLDLPSSFCTDRFSVAVYGAGLAGDLTFIEVRAATGLKKETIGGVPSSMFSLWSVCTGLRLRF